MRTEKELTDKELTNVTGGVVPGSGSGGDYFPSSPSTTPNPSTPTESFSVPVKGEENEHIDIIG